MENFIKKYNDLITIYLITWNEELLLPFAVEHYRRRFPNCKIVIYDNESSDCTIKCASELQCEVITFNTYNKLSDLMFQYIKNTHWKTAETPWVLICDLDEWLDISEGELRVEESYGRTIIQAEGYMMVNMEDNLNIAGINHGYRDEQVAIFYDKCLLFNRTQITNINYIMGAHACNPDGNVNYGTKKYPMYHYKYLSPDYLVERYKMYRERLSDANKENSWGGSCLSTELTIRTQFIQFREIVKKLF